MTTRRNLQNRLDRLAAASGQECSPEEWAARFVRDSSGGVVAEKSADTIPVARFENEHYQIDICAALDAIPEWIDVDEDLPVIAP